MGLSSCAHSCWAALPRLAFCMQWGQGLHSMRQKLDARSKLCLCISCMNLHLMYEMKLASHNGSTSMQTSGSSQPTRCSEVDLSVATPCQGEAKDAPKLIWSGLPAKLSRRLTLPTLTCKPAMLLSSARDLSNQFKDMLVTRSIGLASLPTAQRTLAHNIM